MIGFTINCNILPPTEVLPVLEVLTPTTVTILLLRLLGDNSGPLDITALVVTVEVGIERDGLGFPS